MQNHLKGECTNARLFPLTSTRSDGYTHFLDDNAGRDGPAFERLQPPKFPAPTESPAPRRPAGMQTPPQVAAPPQRASGPQEPSGSPPTPGVTLNPEERPPSGASSEFSTDFSIHSVPYSEILSGAPPKDGIPAIDDPQFVSVTDADEWPADREPVILFHLGV